MSADAHSFTMGPSLLFCPADRPERFDKAAARADAVILDLEDAVAPEAKAAARENIINHPLDPATTIVRINQLDGGEAALDLAALAQTNYRTIMVAKSEDADAVAVLAQYSIVALCESAKGILAAPALARQHNVVALMWGAEDLVASLGGTSSRNDDGSYRSLALHARSQVLLAAGAHGKAAIDAVYVNIPDLDGLAAEVSDAAASGFAATACIHPSQVAVIRQAFLPTPEQVNEAHDLLNAAKVAGTGVFAYQGRMVDGPILKHAAQTLRRAKPLVETP